MGLTGKEDPEEERAWRRRGEEEACEFGTQVSSAGVRYFWRRIRRFNRDSHYFMRVRTV